MRVMADAAVASWIVMANADAPFGISIVIRSYERGGALIELVEACLRQRDVPAFEIVIVEQSQHMAAAHRERLNQLALDPRVRVIEKPPLGGPRARNVGAAAAAGDILVFMDDDDLPGDDRWLATHLANFDDPECLGVTGRQVDPGRPPPSAKRLARARRRVCSYVPVVMWQRVHTIADRRRRVDTVHGGNVSLRRSVLLRVGLWDECTPVEDELSFNYRLRRAMRPGEYLVFDPAATMIRRRDIAGGMGKRDASVVELGARIFEFLHRITAYYFPLRFVVLYPVFLGLLYVVCCDEIWNDLHRQGGVVRRAGKTVALLAGFPVLWLVWTLRLARKLRRHGRARLGIERVPRLRGSHAAARHASLPAWRAA